MVTKTEKIAVFLNVPYKYTLNNWTSKLTMVPVAILGQHSDLLYKTRYLRPGYMEFGSIKSFPHLECLVIDSMLLVRMTSSYFLNV